LVSLRKDTKTGYSKRSPTAALRAGEKNEKDISGRETEEENFQLRAGCSWPSLYPSVAALFFEK